MERKVEFNSCGDTIVGVLHIPDGASGPVPAVILAGGWCYVKEIVMPYYAQAFLDAGVACLLFDYRNFGESGGEPRQHIDPWGQIEDYRNAVSYMRTLDEIDNDKLGIWGIYSDLRSIKRDHLTGLPHKSVFLDRVSEELRRSLTSDTLVAVLLLDVEGSEAEVSSTVDEITALLRERGALELRTARTVALSGAVLALGLFPSAGTDTQSTGRAATEGRSAAVGQSDDNGVSRIRRNRQMGFGRRGGDR